MPLLRQKSPNSGLRYHRRFLCLWQYHIAYVYMGICLSDFILFPILWGVLQLVEKGDVTIMWSPITLSNAGLFHLSFGAILGVSANNKNRTDNKIRAEDMITSEPSPGLNLIRPIVNHPLIKSLHAIIRRK